MIEMIIESIRVNPRTYQRVVILQQKGGEKCLPIWIGPAEADAIAIKMQGLDAPRPLTHDLLLAITEALGGSIKYIVVSDLKNDTFYAKIIFNSIDGIENAVDCRPSDAVALALRAEVPIRVEESVLHKAGIALDKETGKPVVNEERDTREPKPVTDKELEGLAPFKDLVDNLDLEDFGKKEGESPNGPD